MCLVASKPVLDIEQNGRGLFGQGLRNQSFELRHHFCAWLAAPNSRASMFLSSPR